MKATCIEWNVENKDVLSLLPKEIEIPDWMEKEEIDDFISDVTGFCHNGYVLEDD